MWKNIVEPDRPQMTVLHVHFAYQITMAANTHLEYVIFNVFFTTTVIVQTCLNVTLYVHILPCFYC